jgi:serine protease inhibitor
MQPGEETLMGGSRTVATVLVAAMLLAGCGDDAGGPPDRPDGTEAPGTVQELDEVAAAESAAAVNRFGFDLHRQLAAEGGNVVTSPLSIATLLAMVAAGAGGATAAQMAEVLGLDGERDARFAALLRQVSDSDDVTLAVANSVWADPSAPLEPDYLEHVRQVFGASAEAAPLGEQSTADAIDRWVSERTEGLIDDFARALGLPDPRAVVVLLGAVYFLGGWTVEFDPEMTRDSTFTLADGGTVEVPMMNRTTGPDESVEVAERDGYQLLRMPYGDDQLHVMDVFLPGPERDLPWLLARLDPDERSDAIGELGAGPIEVSLPRFELEWEDSLVDPLVAMGMELPFSPAADFTPMSPATPSLSEVAHATYVRVDEQGTEAAAVTGGVGIVSMPPAFSADRPFLFTITDTRTDTVVFLGTIEDPTG